MVSKKVASKRGLSELQPLHHRAHGAVYHEDSLA